MSRYDASEIEPKWMRIWEEEGLYRASDDPDDPRPRFYALDMFPYPRATCIWGTRRHSAAATHRDTMSYPSDVGSRRA